MITDATNLIWFILVGVPIAIAWKRSVSSVKSIREEHAAVMANLLERNEKLDQELADERSSRRTLVATMQSSVEDAQRALPLAEAELREAAELKRKVGEYRDLAYRLERQKDMWKRMFMDQTSAHLSAQNLLEGALQRDRQVTVRAVRTVNIMRAERDLPQLKDASDLADKTDFGAAPVGTALDFAKSMRATFDAASADIDARDELRKIDRSEPDAGNPDLPA